MPLRLVGGLFLLYLAWKTATSQPATKSAPAPQRGLAADYASTLLLTVTNPATILSFIAVFAGLGLAGAGGDFLSATWLVSGVFLGSAGWWFLLSGGVGWFRDKLDPHHLRWINWISGGILGAFGLVALWGLHR